MVINLSCNLGFTPKDTLLTCNNGKEYDFECIQDSNWLKLVECDAGGKKLTIDQMESEQLEHLDPLEDGAKVKCNPGEGLCPDNCNVNLPENGV